MVRVKTIRQLLACYGGDQKTPAADSRYIRSNYWRHIETHEVWNPKQLFPPLKHLQKHTITWVAVKKKTVDIYKELGNKWHYSELNMELFECKTTPLQYSCPLSVNKTEGKIICKKDV